MKTLDEILEENPALGDDLAELHARLERLRAAWNTLLSRHAYRVANEGGPDFVVDGLQMGGELVPLADAMTKVLEVLW